MKKIILLVVFIQFNLYASQKAKLNQDELNTSLLQTIKFFHVQQEEMMHPDSSMGMLDIDRMSRAMPSSNSKEIADAQNRLMPYDFIAWLIDHGADVNFKNGAGETPLTQSMALHGNEKVQTLLLNKGALVDKFNGLGETALMKAAGEQYGSRNVSLLLAHKANPNVLDRAKNTPLMRALANNNDHLVVSLIKAGAKVNPQNNNGDAALHIAARKGSISAIVALINANANPNLANKQNETFYTLMQTNNALFANEQIQEALKAYKMRVVERVKGGWVEAYTPETRAVHDPHIANIVTGYLVDAPMEIDEPEKKVSAFQEK